MNLLSNNIHICMMCNYLIFYMYKIYSFDQCKYIVNIVFNLRHSLKDNLHKFLFGYSSNFENILRLFDRVRFLQNILYICLDLKNHKWHMMMNMQLNILFYHLKVHNHQHICCKLNLNYNQHSL